MQVHASTQGVARNLESDTNNCSTLHHDTPGVRPPAPARQDGLDIASDAETRRVPRRTAPDRANQARAAAKGAFEAARSATLRFMITDAQCDSYEVNGFVVIPNAFGPEVTEPLLAAVGSGTLSVIDSSGNSQEVNVWTYCGDDLVGRVPRSEPMVATAETLLDEAVYHWHSKISWKRPHSAGTWDWHQDYAFWVEEGCDRPAMTTVSIALDDQDADNGCMRVIRGSHRQGVIPHPPVGASRAADPDTIETCIANGDLVDLVLNAGDVVAFHCNVLHSSGPNTTDRNRTLLHASYNAVTNPPSDPFIAGHEPNPLDRLPSNALAPAAWSQVFGETRFIPASEDRYGGRHGYQVN